MNDREFENYLALLSGMLRLRRTQQSDIAGELRDHLIEHVAELERRAVPHEQAVRKALQEFGDAAALAASFSALVRTRRRRLIMRCTIGTSLVMAGLMIGVFAFRPPVENDSIVAQAQQGPEEGTKQKAKGTTKGDESRDLDHKTRAQLKKLTEMDFTEIPLREALDYIKDRHEIQFFFDKRAMDEANAPIDTPVTFNMHSVPVEMVLDLVLNQIRLGFTVRNGVVIVTTEDALANSAEVRVYRVPEGGADELAQLIPATIDPGSWRYSPVPAGLFGYGGGMAAMPGAGGPPGANPVGGDGGFGVPGGTGLGGLEEAGGVGSIRVFRGVLVVSQTPEVHQKIEKLLDDLDKVLPAQGKTSAAGMMGPHSAPGYSGTTAPPPAGYPGGYSTNPGSPQYPGQSGPTNPYRSPHYPGGAGPRYPQPSDASAAGAAEEFIPPAEAPATGRGQPSRGAELPPPVRGEGEDVEAAPAPRDSSGGGSTTNQPPRDGSGTVTKEPPRTPGKARN